MRLRALSDSELDLCRAESTLGGAPGFSAAPLRSTQVREPGVDPAEPSPAEEGAERGWGVRGWGKFVFSGVKSRVSRTGGRGGGRLSIHQKVTTAVSRTKPPPPAPRFPGESEREQRSPANRRAPSIRLRRDPLAARPRKSGRYEVRGERPDANDPASRATSSGASSAWREPFPAHSRGVSFPSSAKAAWMRTRTRLCRNVR